jgi:fluoride exporter
VTWVGVALAGAAGAVLRYTIERVVGPPRRARLPGAAWIINPTGSLALGVIVGLGLAHGADPTAVTVAGTGFVGAYTVVGPLTFDSLRLWLEDARVTAVVNCLGALVVCVAAAAIGLAVTGAL